MILSAAIAAVRMITPVPTAVTLASAGDNLIHSPIYKSVRTRDGGYDFTPIYSEVRDVISSADVATVNQETPLGEENFSGYPKFCSPRQVGDALAWAGFDVISIANNHMLDRGDAGLEYTKNYLSSAVEAVVGYDRETVAVVERGGIKLGFIAFTYSTNCDGYSDIPRLSEENVRALCEKARPMCDVLICSVHFGDEFDSGEYVGHFEPTDSQKAYAALLAGCGVDIILGSHPHVLQRIEWLECDGHRTICAYSLGNFLSNMRYGVQMLGGIFRVCISKQGGKIILYNPELIPTVCHFTSAHSGYKIIPLSEYSDAMCRAHGTQDEWNEKPFSMKTLYDYYIGNIPEEFRSADIQKVNKPAYMGLNIPNIRRKQENELPNASPRRSDRYDHEPSLLLRYDDDDGGKSFHQRFERCRMDKPVGC